MATMDFFCSFWLGPHTPSTGFLYLKKSKQQQQNSMSYILAPTRGITMFVFLQLSENVENNSNFSAIFGKKLDLL